MKLKLNERCCGEAKELLNQGKLNDISHKNKIKCFHTLCEYGNLELLNNFNKQFYNQISENDRVDGIKLACKNGFLQTKSATSLNSLNLLITVAIFILYILLNILLQI